MAPSGQATTHSPQAWQASARGVYAVIRPCTTLLSRCNHERRAKSSSSIRSTSNTWYGQTASQARFPSQRPRSTTGTNAPGVAPHFAPGRSRCRAARCASAGFRACSRGSCMMVSRSARVASADTSRGTQPCPHVVVCQPWTQSTWLAVARWAQPPWSTHHRQNFLKAGPPSSQALRPPREDPLLLPTQLSCAGPGRMGPGGSLAVLSPPSLVPTQAGLVGARSFGTPQRGGRCGRDRRGWFALRILGWSTHRPGQFRLLPERRLENGAGMGAEFDEPRGSRIMLWATPVSGLATNGSQQPELGILHSSVVRHEQFRIHFTEQVNQEIEEADPCPIALSGRKAAANSLPVNRCRTELFLSSEFDGVGNRARGERGRSGQ